jgi:hypothetical protein
MQKTSEVYSKLYHYTTWEGVQGILESNNLRATNYKFLNDYSEIILFKEKLVSLVHPYVLEGFEDLMKHSPEIKQKILDHGGLDKVVQHDAEGHVDILYNALGDEIYILSFCGPPEKPNMINNGLLSQWRGYGTGGGAALVFDTKKLEEILATEVTRFEYSPILIADVIYSDNEQKLKEELSEDLRKIKDITQEFFDHERLRQNAKVYASGAYYSFVGCISRYKHYGFSEENEVRVVALPTVIDREAVEWASSAGVTLKPEKERKFRQKNGHLIPYIELFNSPDIELPIEKIIVGPHKQKEGRAIKLREKVGNPNIEVICSEIPYVC